MKVYHLSPAYNFDSLRERGVLTCYSTSEVKKVWVCEHKQRNWAKHHVAKRWGVKPEEVVIFCLEVPPDYLSRHNDGIWYSTEDLPPAFFTGWHFTSKPAA